MASKNLPMIDWLKIEASAPGKFIISGEYSVVYEKQAIAAAIDLRTKVTIRPNEDNKVRLNLKNLGTVREWPTSSMRCRLVPKYSECLEYNNSMPKELNHLLNARFKCQSSAQTASTSRLEVDKKARLDQGQCNSDSEVTKLEPNEGVANSQQCTKVKTEQANGDTPDELTQPDLVETGAPERVKIEPYQNKGDAKVKSEQQTATTSGHDLKVKIDKLPEAGKGTEEELEKKADDAAMAFLLLYIGLGDSYCSSARVPIDVEIESTVPVGSGLGSSSAYSVALCGALMRVFRVAAERYIISNWAFNIDKFFHGKPSGVDNNVVAHGSYILFQNGKTKATGVTHKNPVRVMLIDTGVSRSTRALSEKVMSLQRDNPSQANTIFNSINELTTHIWRRLNDNDFSPRSIADLIKANQECLDALGVGHAKLSDICSRAQNYDLRAKQTGAGGGGTAFVLYDDSDNCRNIKQFRKELEDAGYYVHDHAIGCDGLIVKITPDPDKRFPASEG